jgi:hypothetical protein
LNFNDKILFARDKVKDSPKKNKKKWSGLNEISQQINWSW